MCGIAGYIGEAKKAAVTQQIITKLFEKSESRGLDAAGYWGTERAADGSVLYHKEPLNSAAFVEKDVWKNTFKYNTNLLLVHARGASKGVGEPFYNQNNHPFVNSNKSVGLVHNGRVDDLEYRALKQKYVTKSQCDSEILLRIFEGGEAYDIETLREVFNGANMPHRLAGIRDIFNYITSGHMAVAVGERGLYGDRYLWLFRNTFRPLWIVDVRNVLGQIFFVSEPTIWEDALLECTGIKQVAHSQKLIELPPDEVWAFSISESEAVPKTVQRFEVERSSFASRTFDGKKFSAEKKEETFPVHTYMDEFDSVKTEAKKPTVLLPDGEFDNRDLWKLDDVCKRLKDKIDMIHSSAEELVTYGSIDKNSFSQLIADLNGFNSDLDNLTAGL